jgi:hypothetical protein
LIERSVRKPINPKNDPKTSSGYLLSAAPDDELFFESVEAGGLLSLDDFSSDDFSSE